MTTSAQTHWSIIKKAFRKNRLALWSLRILYVLLFIALFANFIANEKPIYCQVDGENYFPVFRSYAVDLGLSKPTAKFLNKSWHEIEYDKVIFPPIPFSPHTLDTKMAYKSPYEKPALFSKYRHWLGTSGSGKDVAAGMIHGTRTAMLVGIISMGIASIIGIFLGCLAGYFGDNKLKISRARLWFNLLALVFAFFYGFSVRYYTLIDAGSEGHFVTAFLGSLLIIFLIFLIANLIVYALKRFPFFAKKITLPVDIIVMRLIEVMNSIPVLLLLLAFLKIINSSSIFYVMVIIGFLGWTRIARFMRAELLKIRKLEYITAAEVMGLSEWRTIFRHAIPNAINPVLITIAFGVAAAILLEAAISFLGIGIGENEVSWGKILSHARQKSSAWWLSVLPGFAIFITITVLNLIGEGLSEAINPQQKQ